MTKEDKQFFTGLFKGIDKKFDRLEVKVEENSKDITSLGTKVEENSKNISSLGVKVDKNSGEITSLGAKVEEWSIETHYNGVLLEKMQDDLMQIKEGDVSVMMLHEKVDYILEEIEDLPSMKAAIKNHSRQLAALSAKS